MPRHKKCIKCDEKKDLKQFAFKNKAKGIRSSICRACHKEYVVDHYQRNKSAYNHRARCNMPRYRKKLQQAIIDYLKTHPCVDCGENDPVVLDFDHRDSSKKIMAVAQLITKIVSLDRLMIEIEKCDIRCANCHRRRTAKVFSYYKTIMPG